MRESGIPEPHRRPVVELDVEAVAPVLGDAIKDQTGIIPT
jgi:hypothetical protein